MNRLAIIPARGGSKRIPKKNIKEFCGKPMISYPLETLKKSGLFHTIHVSTDCHEISKIVEELGFNIDFLRDSSLADDFTPIMPVLQWTLKEYEAREIYFDEVVLVMACTPFIEASDLIEASKLMQNNANAKPVIAISSYPAPIEWAFERNETNGVLTALNQGMFKIRSQDLQKKYYDAGAFIFFSKEHILNSDGSNDDISLIGYIVEKIKGIDIDDIDDWEFAEKLMKANNY